MLAEKEVDKFVDMRNFMNSMLSFPDNNLAKVSEERFEQLVHAEGGHGQTDVKGSKNSRILEVRLLKEFGDFGLLRVELKELKKKA